ncbi:hypothetical protein UFOVP32_36 [uncultured Caudovirales phage]|uniref:Uncharacterized protein n=1 Tax=uncultured Caudovirales phage TaxID=2100421 RepID=A0A6J5KMS5_9CAUD|nr:hypothetical protein UFOVP32_36 [uncultured Caudovirales phage]CAB4123676.1 hypothetical protein UFOVP50_40 [uncultured Caudovirales phage]
MSPRPSVITKAHLRKVLDAVAEQPTPYTVEVTPDGTVRMTPYNARDAKDAVKPSLAYRKEIRL